eukprot:1630728-Prymnesium_polylepis.1
MRRVRTLASRALARIVRRRTLRGQVGLGAHQHDRDVVELRADVAQPAPRAVERRAARRIVDERRRRRAAKVLPREAAVLLLPGGVPDRQADVLAAVRHRVHAEAAADRRLR